jgi:alcohol-forming fatty acyl-CoA reductase
MNERAAGSTVLLTGGSGFLGKTVLATLLARHEEIGRVRVLLRAPDQAAAQRRLTEEVLTSEALSGLSPAKIRAQLDAGQLCAAAGNLDADDFAERARTSLGEVDVAIHCAASVSFEEALDDALAINALGPTRLLGGLQAAGSNPHFIHVSTAYVADCRTATVREDDSPLPVPLDPGQMMERAREWRVLAGRESRLAGRERRFRRTAERDVAHARAADVPSRSEQLRRRWVAQHLAAKGRGFARAAGWPDTYALTKAVAENLLSERCQRATIVRPTIIESALHQPHPGWLEGIKVADPLILAYAARGLTDLPGRPDNRIDIVPVDLVANACVAAALYPPAEGVRILAIASSACNPLTLGDLAAHTRAYFQREPLRGRDGKPIAIGDLRFVSRRTALRRATRRQRLLDLAARAAAIAHAPLATEKALRRNAALAARVTRMVNIYGPYTELDCGFDDSRARDFAAALPAAVRSALPFDCAEFDWEDYLQRVHLPQVHRMVAA